MFFESEVDHVATRSAVLWISSRAIVEKSLVVQKQNEVDVIGNRRLIDGSMRQISLGDRRSGGYSTNREWDNCS